MTPAYAINVLLYVLPCFLILFLAFKSHIKAPLFPRAFISILIFSAIAFLGACAFIATDSPPLRTLYSIPVMLAGVWVFCSATVYNLWQGLFIICITKCYIENIHLLSLYLYFAVTREFLAPSKTQVLLTTLPLTVITFPVIYAFYTKLLRPALDYTISLKIWRSIWMIPACYTLIHSLLVTPAVSSPSFLPGNTLFFIPPLWTFLIFTTYVILLRMIISINKNALLQETLHLLETQRNAQEKQLDIFQRYAEETRRIRHDMRHHMLAFKGFLENKDLDGLENYLHGLTQTFPARPENYCDNPVINALLCYYGEQADKEGIKISFLVSMEGRPPFADTDLCIILGNFLENALDACRRMKSPDKYISLKMSTPSRRTLVIVAENSYEGTIQRAKDGSFLSSKEKDRKGIGISSVINVIEKYNGIPRFEYQEPVFKASLLLSAKEQPQ